jgi:hypothetical protein
MRVRKQFLTIILTAGLLFAPALQAQQSAKPQVGTPAPVLGNGPPPPNGSGYPIAGGPTVPSGFSTAVVSSLQTVAVTAQQHLVSNGTLLASDYTALATSLQTFFAEMDSTGLTATMQSWILSNSALFTTEPSTSVVQAAYSVLEAKGGVVVSESQFVSSIQNEPLASRQQFYSIVQTNGLAYFHAQMIANLQTLASEAVLMHNGVGYVTVGCRAPIIGLGAGYVGVAALAILPPVGVVLGAVAVVVGLASLFGLFGGC